MSTVKAFFSSTGARRKLGGPLRHVVQAYAALIAVLVVYTTVLTYVDLFAMTIAFLSAMLSLVFLVIGPLESSDKEKPNLFDYAASLSSIAAGLYFFIESERIITRITLLHQLTEFDLLFGSLLVILTLEATRRSVGIGLTVIVVLFMLYNLFGHLLPGKIGHGYISYNHFLDIMVFTTDGIFGVPIRVAATYAFLFVLFGTFLAKAGGSDFFFELAAAISGKSAGGPAKIAVVSSGLYGTLSGSPTSDVVVTGSVTIPMMKRLGYPPALAGAVEVAASTGGSLLPPVMGTAAFIMVEFTGIEYREVIISAIMPALLFYLCVFLQVHLRSLKLGLRGMDADELPSLRKTMGNGGLFLVPLAVLVVALLMGYSPTFVAVFAALSVIVVAAAKKSTRMGLIKIYQCLAETTMRMIPVVGACAAAGLVIGGLTMTGLGGKVTDLVLLLAGQNALGALVIAALMAIILGMGMPTPAAFALAYIFVSGTIVELGFSVMGTNMFLLYFSVLSAMTPPVAVAAFAAAAIADANPLEIAVKAVRLAITAFVIPFAFIYGEGILLIGDPVDILHHCLTATAGVVLMGIGCEGYLRDRLPVQARILVGASGLFLIVPLLYTTLAAAGLLLAALLFSAELRHQILNRKAVEKNT
ncbi:MAG: TRAP transporter fused permease subunit [Rhodovibrionaceae bacterium]